METSEFREKMTIFPCMFNMPYFEHTARSRLKDRQCQLERILEEGADTEENETTVKNTLTWIYYQSRLVDRAEAMNESVMIDTGYENIVSLGNCVFMEWMITGRVSEHFKLLEELREKPNFGDKVLDAKAEQAYCQGKMGGMYNLMSAAKIYEDLLAEKGQDEWMYRLGLTYRRLAVMHGLEKASLNKLSRERCHELAKSSFQKVSLSSDRALKAISLANLAAFYSNSNVAMLRDLNTAVMTDPKSDEVYLIAGRGVMRSHPDEAVAWLEKAVQLRPDRSMCHHQLGKAYLNQLRDMGRGQYHRSRDIQGKAQRHLQQAFELSRKMNISPLIDLARIYQKQSDTEMSARQAKTVLASRFLRRDNLFLLIQAHKHLFYLKQNRVTNEERYRHLLLSIIISVCFVKEEGTPEDKHATWASIFESDLKPDGTNMIENASRLVDILKKNEDNVRKCLKSISKFVRDGRIGDVEAIANEVRDIGGSGSNEEALLFLELVSLRPGMDVNMLKDLHWHILEVQAKRCLKDGLMTCSVFFRQCFDLSFPKLEQAQGGGVTEIDPDISINIDMVVLFHDSISNRSTLCADTAYGLEDAIATLFKLKVALNPAVGEARGSSEVDALVEFVEKHQTKLIMLVFEGDGSDTKYLLEKIEPFIGRDQKGHSPSVVLLQCLEEPTGNLPSKLKSLPCLSLGQSDDPFPNLFGLKEVQEKADQCEDMPGFLEAYFHGNTENVSTLFKHLTCNKGKDIPVLY